MCVWVSAIEIGWIFFVRSFIFRNQAKNSILRFPCVCLLFRTLSFHPVSVPCYTLMLMLIPIRTPFRIRVCLCLCMCEDGRINKKVFSSKRFIELHPRFSAGHFVQYYLENAIDWLIEWKRVNEKRRKSKRVCHYVLCQLNIEWMDGWRGEGGGVMSSIGIIQWEVVLFV